MIVGGVGVDVGGKGVEVIVGVSDGVKVMRGVRVGRFVGVRVGVSVGVNVGARTLVGVINASTGYNSRMA